MEEWKLLILGVVIGSNNLAVAFAFGTMDTRPYWWRIIVVFGIFEFVIPLVGILIGQQFSTFIASYASFIGGGILVIFGLFMIYKNFKYNKKEESNLLKKATSWLGIISLSAGLSVDNLIVGFSMGLQNFHPLTISAVIAGSSVLFTFIGLNTGKHVKHHFRKVTDTVAAFLLLLLGIATIFEWL